MDPETEAARRVGTTLCNKWTLERLIGTGGMAAVYVATHKIGRREAIKILHSDVARDPEVRARFEQEADAVNRFKHPGTVEVRDIDVAEDGSPFMVMELLDGQPLSDLARAPGGVDVGTLLRLADELLDVLAAAHTMGIIHRDIKPDNLFVLRDGSLKVLDFGIARVRAGAQTKLHTRVGATLGTAPYMPPEQIRGVEIDARADIFAVGATMFRLVARRRVHDAASEGELLVKMASQQAPPLASVAPEAPPGICLVVDRALMFDRALRYPDAATMQGDVRALREGRPPPYATANAPSSVVLAPSPSDAVTRDAPTRPDWSGEPTAAVSSARMAPPSADDPSSRPTAPDAAAADPATRPAVMVLGAAGLGAPLSASSSAPATASSSAPTPQILHSAVEPANRDARTMPDHTDLAAPPPLDPATRPAMMVLGASGLGAPLAPSSRSGAAAAVQAASARSPVGPMATQPLPAVAPRDATPPNHGPAPAAAERTLRSQQGPVQASAAPAPQGYVLATAAMPVMPASVPASGPRTQLAGTAPPAPPSLPAPTSNLAPGESIPVVAAPPRPRRRLTMPGAETGILPLVAVGVLFAAIGVAITLWLTLREPDAKVATPTTIPAPLQRPTPTSTWSDSDIDPGQRGAHPGIHTTSHAPQPPLKHPTKGH